MKIAYISKADRTGGGASLVAEELTLLFNRNNHQAHHYFAFGAYDDDSKIPLYGSKHIPALFLRRIHTLSKYMGLPEILPVELFFLFYRNRILQYDVVHFHDLSGAISPLTLAIISRLKPTIWTFHDCSPFTGGCLYPMDCHGFKKQCAHCPQLGNWPMDTRIDLTGTLQTIKKKVLQNHNISIVTPSKWMADMVAASRVKGLHPTVIPNGIDTKSYFPKDKITIRKKLGLPVDRYVILIIATYLEDERKGTKYALEALLKIKHLNPFLLLIGNINDTVKQMFRDFDCRATGYIKGDKEKSDFFSASDVFLFSSLADNMPLVVLETMATGTPTVGFQTGGVPEMIEHGASGYLVKPKDVDGLVQGLLLAGDKKNSQKWGYNAGKKVKETYGYNALLDNHLDFYKRKIAGHKRRGADEECTTRY